MIISIPLKVTIRLTPGVVGKLLDRRLATFKPNLAELAARMVLTATLLRTYRALLIAALPKLLTPELDPTVHNQPRSLKGRVTQQDQVQLLDMFQRRDEAVNTGDAAGLRAATRTLNREKVRIASKLFRVGSTMHTGYREKLFEVFDILTNPSNIKFWWVNDTLHYAIGDIALLNQVLTPSFNKKKPYPKALLWKQLEYGAGVYSTDPRGVRRKKGWRFGTLRVLGIKGVGAVKQLQAQVDDPASPFQQQLRSAIVQSMFTG